MPALVPLFCPVFPEDFLQQACVEVRRKTAPHHVVQRFQLALLLYEDTQGGHEEAGRCARLWGSQVQRWRKWWPAGDFSVADMSGRGRKVVFSPSGPRAGQGARL